MTRREKLEALLRDDPDDVFLQYALAMQFVSDGEEPQAINRLQALLEKSPAYVAAYFQLAQLLEKSGAAEHAKQALHQGIQAARQAGDEHAEGEMRGFLQQLEGN